MKKRIVTFVLAFVMIIGMSTPASAHQDTSVTLIPVENFDPKIPPERVTSSTSLPTKGTPVIADEEVQVTSDIRGGAVYVKQIIVYPLVVCLETEKVYRLADVKRSVFLKDGYWTYGMHLTSADLQQILQEANDVLANHSEFSKYTWAICGWWETATFNFVSDRPLRFNVRGSQSKPNWATEYTTETLTSPSTIKTFDYTFPIPTDPSEYYAIGIDGAFYFKYTSGSQEGGCSFNASVSFNY